MVRLEPAGWPGITTKWNEVDSIMSWIHIEIILENETYLAFLISHGTIKP